MGTEATRPGRMHSESALTCHTGVETGRTKHLVGDHRTCSPNYTPQDGLVGLSGGVNGLTGESNHHLLACHH